VRGEGVIVVVVCSLVLHILLVKAGFSLCEPLVGEVVVGLTQALLRASVGAVTPVKPT